MRQVLIAACLVALIGATSAQTERGSLTGTVSGPDGAAVADAPLQAKNTETGAVARTFSSAAGRFMLPNLPAGTYDLLIAVPC